MALSDSNVTAAFVETVAAAHNNALGTIAANVNVMDTAGLQAVLKTLLSDINTEIVASENKLMRYQGSVADLTALAAKSSTAKLGDVWNVQATGNNYIFTGNDTTVPGEDDQTTVPGWDKMATSFQLADYLSNASLEGKYLQIATFNSALAVNGVSGATADGSVAACARSVAGQEVSSAISALKGSSGVTVLGSIAGLSEIAEANLASALATKINGKLDSATYTSALANKDDTGVASDGDIAALARAIAKTEIAGNNSSQATDLQKGVDAKAAVDAIAALTALTGSTAAGDAVSATTGTLNDVITTVNKLVTDVVALVARANGIVSAAATTAA